MLISVASVQTPIMNMTMTEEDSHNLTLLRLPTTPVFARVALASADKLRLAVTGPTTLINITVL